MCDCLSQEYAQEQENRPHGPEIQCANFHLVKIQDFYKWK